MPSRLTLTAFAAACSLVAVPASSLGAIAALQDDRLAAAPLDQVETRLDLAKQTGARVARIDLFWSEIALTRPANPTDPNDPAYDWRLADAKLSGLAKRGITPLISVYSSPTWTTGGQKADDSQYNPFAPSPGDYGNFMSAVAKRYNGSFTPSAPGSTVLPRVRLIEVWNEPQIREFLRVGNATSFPVYLRLLREAYPVIKAANPTAIVIAGVGSPRSTTSEGNIGARLWLQKMAAAPLSVKFDAYSQHIYPAAPPLSRTRAFPSWNSINEILSTLDQRRVRQIRAARGAARLKLIRAPKMKIYITEAGYTTGSTPFRKVQVSLAQQALYLKQIFQHPQVKGNKRVSAIFWFNLQDNPLWPGGLLDGSLNRKPAYAAFTAFTARGALTPDLRP